MVLKANPGSTRVIMESDKNHFWLLFEREKRLHEGGRLAVGGVLFGRLQSSGVGRWLSLQIWLEGQIREERK